MSRNDAANEATPIVSAPEPASPPATPPAKLFKVMGIANFHATPADASCIKSLSPPSQKLFASSNPRYTKMAAENIAARVGAVSPRAVPTSADTKAPTAFASATMAFSLTESGRRWEPSATPTAKLSVDDEMERMTAWRSMADWP
eukprot:CAMPEP_0172600942 /NCGR_PEP_ID=MMETSP1068-20121228/21095_1 /TAXON_ID=35684 /ORGANISM="Pseudopedinella elastica, Strain CCMP716" /LENGTH=144 /DNA_ID=CAMNT_0013401765 /DNA_START=536 /DNA_END=967 /DNA_ORIENTATION=+